MLWTGEKLKEFRLQAGYSQQKLGMMLGFSATGAQSRIGQWERGWRIPENRHKELDELASMIAVSGTPNTENIYEDFMAKKKLKVSVVTLIKQATKLHDDQIAACFSPEPIDNVINATIIKEQSGKKIPAFAQCALNVLGNYLLGEYSGIDLSAKEPQFFDDIRTELFSLSPQHISEENGSALPSQSTQADFEAAAPVQNQASQPSNTRVIDVPEFTQPAVAAEVTLPDGTVVEAVKQSDIPDIAGDTPSDVVVTDTPVEPQSPASTTYPPEKATQTPPAGGINPMAGLVDQQTQPQYTQHHAQSQYTQPPVSQGQQFVPQPAAPQPPVAPQPPAAPQVSVMYDAFVGMYGVQFPQNFLSWYLNQHGVLEWVKGPMVTSPEEIYRNAQSFLQTFNANFPA